MENKINLCTNEILTKIPSTAKLVFYKIAIEDANFEITPEWIEWAAELAQTQYKTPHIIELSHKTDMDDQIYLRGLTNVIFDEFNIDLNDIPTICKCYGIYLIRQGFAENKDVYEILTQLANLFIVTNYYVFYDFYTLHLAYTELKKEGEQNYWDGLDFKNKEEYIRKYLEQWIKNPSSQLYNKWNKKSKFRKTAEIYLFNQYTYWLYIILIFALVLIFYWGIYKLSSNNIMTTITILAFTTSAIIKIIFEIVKVINKRKTNKLLIMSKQKVLAKIRTAKK